MSANLCSDLHTLIVATAMVQAGLESCPVSAAMSLRDANNKAMRARYGDAPQPLGPLSRAQNGTAYTPQQVNSLARGLRYQCAEGDVWETHPIMPALARLIERTGGEEVPTVAGFWSI
jgi:hypothetical protein